MHTSRPASAARADVAAGAASVALGLAIVGWPLLWDAPGPPEGPSFVAMAVAFAVVYGLAGTALAWHGVATVVRRVLLGVGLVHGVAGLVARYADSGLAAHPD